MIMRRLVHLWGGALLVGACGGTVMHLGQTDTDAGVAEGGAAGDPGGASSEGASAGSKAGGASAGGSFSGAAKDDAAGGSAVGRAGAGGGVFCDPGRLPVSEVRPLTPLEYDRTVYDLVGDVPPEPRRLNEPYGESGFISSVGVPPLLADQLLTAALDVAARATNDIDQLLHCAAGAERSDDCALQFLRDLTARAFRRPLTSTELTALELRYATARATATIASAVRDAMAWSLDQPSFYLVESGSPGSGGLVPPYPFASRLSYFLTRTMPDAALLASAAAGELGSVAGVAGQARRLLATPGAHDAMRDFFTQWLSLDAVDGYAKDPVLFPTFLALSRDMKTETMLFTDHVVFSGGTWASLLVNDTTFVNDALASLYGAPMVGANFRAVPVAGLNGRSGLLTQASWLTATSPTSVSNPVRRGAFVRRRLLCQDIPAPPANVNTTLDDTSSAATTRQRFARHESSPSCAGCHTLMDPIGFGLEHYDAIGRYRVLDNGLPVDATGSLDGLNTGPITFDGAAALSQTLASMPEVGDCIATQFFRFALLRREGDADVCSLTSAQSALQNGGFTEMLVAIATSDSFRYANW